MCNRYPVTSFFFVLTIFVSTIVTAITLLYFFSSFSYIEVEIVSTFSNDFLSKAYAQISDDLLLPGNPLYSQNPNNPTSSLALSATSSVINNSNTFFTKGMLATVLTPSPSYLKSHMPTEIQNQQQRPDNADGNQIIQTDLFYLYPKLVSGVWSLNVSRGLVTDFHANFKLISINGVDKHFVELLNFQNANNSLVRFNQFFSTSINGFVDVKIDNEIFMNKVPITIQLFKINTVGLTIKDALVANIFYDNELLGITDSFKNFKNNELLILEEDDKP